MCCIEDHPAFRAVSIIGLFLDNTQLRQQCIKNLCAVCNLGVATSSSVFEFCDVDVYTSFVLPCRKESKMPMKHHDFENLARIMMSSSNINGASMRPSTAQPSTFIESLACKTLRELILSDRNLLSSCDTDWHMKFGRALMAKLDIVDIDLKMEILTVILACILQSENFRCCFDFNIDDKKISVDPLIRYCLCDNSDGSIASVSFVILFILSMQALKFKALRTNSADEDATNIPVTFLNHLKLPDPRQLPSSLSNHIVHYFKELLGLKRIDSSPNTHALNFDVEEDISR